MIRWSAWHSHGNDIDFDDWLRFTAISLHSILDNWMKILRHWTGGGVDGDRKIVAFYSIIDRDHL